MENEATQEGSEEQAAEQSAPEVWVELKRGTEGVSVTVYKSCTDGSVDVVNEAWWSWSEFTGITTQDLQISRGGTTRLDAVGSEELLTAETVWDTVQGTTLVPDAVDRSEAHEQLSASL